MSRFSGISIFLVAATVLAAFVLLSAIPVVAQATISTGSIQGTITDPQGAVVTGAKVIVANRGTGQKVTFNTSSTGAFTTGALIPGDYLVRIEAPGFESAEKPVVVQVGVITPANIKMTIGKETQTITVEGNAVTVNTMGLDASVPGSTLSAVGTTGQTFTLGNQTFSGGPTGPNIIVSNTNSTQGVAISSTATRRTRRCRRLPWRRAPRARRERLRPLPHPLGAVAPGAGAPPRMNVIIRDAAYHNLERYILGSQTIVLALQTQ